MSESSPGSGFVQPPGEAFWKGHVLTAEDFRGSNVEYCRRHGLNPATFSTYKVRLGFSKHKKHRAPEKHPPPAFVQIQPPKVLPTGPTASPSGPPAGHKHPRSLFPDATWAAEFVSALFAQSR